VAEAGLRPATSLLGNRQRHFALRLAVLPSSDLACCVVGAKDALGQQLETAIWTDGSRLEDGSVGCAVARYHPEHDAWTGVRVHIGKNQEVYDAELHAIYRAMLTLFQEPRGQKITICADAQAALWRIRTGERVED